MIVFDWVRVFAVAVMGASLTTALRTGSLWPVFPTVTRTDAPRKYWMGIAFYSWFVLSFFAGLLWLLYLR